MVASVAVRSRAMVLLLLIHCSLMLPLFVRGAFDPCFCCCLCVFFSMAYALSSFAIVSLSKRELVVFFSMSCDN